MPPPRELRTVAIKVCVDLGFVRLCLCRASFRLVLGRWGAAGGRPHRHRALLRRIPTFRGLLGLVFVRFLLSSTGVTPADGGVGQPLLENRAYGTGIIASTVKVDSR